MTDKWAEYRNKFCGCKDASRDNSCKGLHNCELRADHPERKQAMNSDIKDHSNDVQQEAQGLEVVGYFFQHEETGQVMSVDTQQVEWGFEKNNQRLVNMGAICRLSDADARDAQRLAVIYQLRADLETANSMLVATSKAGIQLRERVAELERAITSSLPCIYYMDLPDGGDPSLEEQLRRMAEDAANLRIAELRLHEVATHCATVEQELAALKSAPVVMPERIIFPTMLRKMWSGGEVQEWLDEYVARLNRSKT